MNTTTHANAPGAGPGANGAAGYQGTRANRLGDLARWCYRHRRQVLLAWVLLLVVVTALSQLVPGRFENKFASGSSESARAQTLLKRRFPARAGDTGDIVFHTTGPIDSPAEQAAITRIVAAVTGLPHVAGVQSPFGP